MDYNNLTPEQIKKLKSIEKRIKKCNEEIQQMGFNVYLACNTVNIMDGDSHGKNHEPLHENVRHHFMLKGWDGGDW